MIGRGDSEGWIILRTSGGRTLALAASLDAAGIPAWTPRQTSQRLIRRGRTEVKREIDAPILPTFVFAAATELVAIAAIAAKPVSGHPSFSIFNQGGRVPVLRAAQIDALRQAEAQADAAIEQVREADTAEELRQARVAMLRTEKARRAALRAERRDFAIGARVEVQDAPALAGLVGTVVESRGTVAMVIFGNALEMEIEAWRLLPRDVEARATDAA